MTVVAAFRIHGLPILVGDMLITTPAANAAESWLSTAPAFAEKMPEELGVRIPETRKKVHLIGNHLAVAWSGAALAARSVFQILNNAFSNSKPTQSDLEAVLCPITDWIDERFSIHVIGWLVDSEPRCFRWNSAYPQTIFFDEPNFEGSGENLFLAKVNEVVSASGQGPGVESAQEAAILFILAKLAKLIENEICTGETLANRFGYCYDIAIFNGSEFRYIPSVTYLMWDVNRDFSGIDKWYLKSPIVLYKNCNEFSIVKITNLDNVDGSRSKITMDAVTPIFDNMCSLNVAGLGRQDVASDYYCNFIRFRRLSCQTSTATIVVAKTDNQFMWHEVKNGKDYFHLNAAEIKKQFGNDMFAAA